MWNSRLGRAWVPALLWLVVITLESTAGSSENTSRILLPLLTFFFGNIPHPTFLYLHASLRKAGHFFGYAVLSLFMYRAWWATLARESPLVSWYDMLRQWSARAALLALLCTATVAGLDEFHQAFLPTRGGSVKDVFLDSVAGIFTQVLLIAFSSVRIARKKQLAISN